jgi:cyclo(L-tyrosyl-L-tyrosyl) synthase
MELSDFSEVEACPIGQQSKLIYKEKKHILIGISPFNSYFSEERIFRLTEWAFKNFESVHLFIPDFISSYTLQAIGYEKQDAERKTKRQDCYLRNKAAKALSRLGKSEDTIVTISALLSNVRYQEVYNHCLSMFDTNKEFKDACIQTAHHILSLSEKVDEITEEKINIAVKYFLHEFPLFIKTSYILQVKSSVFAYNKPPDFLIEIFNKGIMIDERQGFLKVEAIIKNSDQFILGEARGKEQQKSQERT